MNIPPAMTIEIAADSLKSIKLEAKSDQQKELTSFGDTRAKEIGASGLTDDFRVGYELGLQVARVTIETNVMLSVQGINPEDIL